MLRMMALASFAIRTIWGTVAAHSVGFSGSFQPSQYLILPAAWVAMAVTKSFQCWSVPVPSGLRSFGGSQAPGAQKAAQEVSSGFEEAHPGVLPKVYITSLTPCDCAVASQ